MSASQKISRPISPRSRTTYCDMERSSVRKVVLLLLVARHGRRPFRRLHDSGPAGRQGELVPRLDLGEDHLLEELRFRPGGRWVGPEVAELLWIVRQIVQF